MAGAMPVAVPRVEDAPAAGAIRVAGFQAGVTAAAVAAFPAGVVTPAGVVAEVAGAADTTNSLSHGKC